MAKRYVGIKFETTNRIYTYSVPDSISAKLSVGMHVKVPGSVYHPSARWMKIAEIPENVTEKRGVVYKDILEVRMPESKAEKSAKDAARSAEKAALAELLAQQAVKQARDPNVPVSRVDERSYSERERDFVDAMERKYRRAQSTDRYPGTDWLDDMM